MHMRHLRAVILDLHKRCDHATAVFTHLTTGEDVDAAVGQKWVEACEAVDQELQELQDLEKEAEVCDIGEDMIMLTMLNGKIR